MLPVAEYYSKEMPECLIKIYYEQAKELSVECLEFLISMHMKDPDQGRFFPTFAHLLAQAGTENDIKAEAHKAFDKNPCIDGVCSYEVRHESIDKRNLRRSAYIRNYVSDWKDCSEIEKISFSTRIPEEITKQLINQNNLLGSDK